MADPSEDAPPSSWTPPELGERFAALVRASAQVFYQMSPDWSEMRQLRGGGFLTDTDRPRSSWQNEYIYAEDRPMVDAAIAAAVATRSVFELEHRVLQADGSVGWTSSRAVPILAPDGEIREWFGAASDITEHKQAEYERRRSAEREHEFVANAAHQLGTPVTAIRACVDVLLMPQLLPEQRARTLEHLDREAHRLSRLHESLLVLAQIDASAHRLAARVDIGAVLKETAARLAPHPGVRIGVSVPPALCATVDLGLLESVIDNLATNAARYTGEGSIELGARAEAGQVVIEVADTGAGLSDHDAARATERFFRGAQPDPAGFGLGLAIAHQAATALGGTLTLHPGDPHGTVARLTLAAAD